MKIIILVLFSICFFTHSNAQTKSLDAKQELLDLLKSKHDWERAGYGSEKKASFKTKYEESYAKIQGNRDSIIVYIDKALKVDAQALTKEFIYYDYWNPAMSVVHPKSRMSLLTYYKIVKYSLDDSRIKLPYLSDIPFL
jgi:hypothetical protein